MIERFWLFHSAYIRIPTNAVVADGGWQILRLPFMGAVAEHSERGLILFDAPYGHEGPTNMGIFTGSILRRAGLVFKEEWSIVPRLEELGLRAADVSHILLSHLHSDHTGGMKTMAHAQFHLAKAEWDWALEGSERRAAARGYARTDFVALRDRIEFLDQIPHLADSHQGLDIFGDGSVEMFFLPGHTPGHCGFRIHRKEGPPIFYLGDAAFTVPQILGEEELGVFPRLSASSMGGVRTTLRALRRHFKQYPDDIPITCHDPALGAQSIEKGPIFL